MLVTLNINATYCDVIISPIILDIISHRIEWSKH